MGDKILDNNRPSSQRPVNLSSVHPVSAGASTQSASIHLPTGNDGGSFRSWSTGRRPSADASVGPFDQTGKPRPKAELLMKSLRGPGAITDKSSSQEDQEARSQKGYRSEANDGEASNAALP